MDPLKGCHLKDVADVQTVTSRPVSNKCKNVDGLCSY
jgi:hypothetical protein